MYCPSLPLPLLKQESGDRRPDVALLSVLKADSSSILFLSLPFQSKPHLRPPSGIEQLSAALPPLPPFVSQHGPKRGGGRSANPACPVLLTQTRVVKAERKRVVGVGGKLSQKSGSRHDVSSMSRSTESGELLQRSPRMPVAAFLLVRSPVDCGFRTT